MGPQYQLSDFVGEHGPYQLYISVFLFVRYVFLGLMANSGPLMTPDVTFYCSLPMEEIVAIMPNITTLNATEQELEIREEFKRICQLDLHLYQQQAYNWNEISLKVTGAVSKATTNTTISNSQQPFKSWPKNLNASGTSSENRIRECSDFSYDIAPDQGRTMTSEFDLVCGRDWLRSLFQSLLSAAIVVAHVFWGTFSDKYGRFKAQKLCLLVSLGAGILSIFAMDFWTFTLARALCSFGDLGLVVSLTTTVVELVGNQYRGLSVAIVNFGYALGVTILPYIVAYFEDFRAVIICTVLCHIISMPFVWTTNESVRWLLTNRKFNFAKKELKRIARWNRSSLLTCYVWPIRALKRRTNKQKHQQKLQVEEGEIVITAAPVATTEQTNPQSNKSISKRIQRDEEEEAFDFRFTKFIGQIESQNFCDPLGIRCESSSSRETSPIAAAAACDELNVSSSDTPTSQTPSPEPPQEDRAQKSLSLIITPPAAVSETNIVEDGDSSPGITLAPVIDRRAAISSWLHLAARRAEAGIAREPRPIELAFIKGAGGQQQGVPSKSGSIADDCELGAGAADQLLVGESQVTPDDSQQQQQQQEQKSSSLLRLSKPTQQPDCINLVAHQLSFVGRVNRLFRDKKLMVAVFTIVWTTFNSELEYTSFIIINLEVGEDVYLNYILGGCMEALAAISASTLLSYAPRRHSLITFWLLISISCCGLSIAHIDSTWAVWLLALAKFSQSCLSSIASVAAYESFPTFLRQSGSGLVSTLGMLGSVFAPLIFAEFDDQAGMDRVLMTFSISSLTAATLIYLFLKETRNCELQ